MRYEFTLAHRPSDTVLAAFPELTEAPSVPRPAILSGPVTDRAHLDGLLARFSCLGLEVVDVHRLPD